MAIEDALKLLVQVLDSLRAHRMQDAMYVHFQVSVKVCATPHRHDYLALRCTQGWLPNAKRISAGSFRGRPGAGVLSAALAAVSSAARGIQTAAHGGDQMRFPAVDPAMPVQPSLVGFRIH
ncbi:MAG: hypothetical protein RMK84_13205 [Oscillochloridaceae bacterium]|nr:hypothetical protein [Chloroflexaceae bacterium]MDW8391078.1 hypothetical protein [Oscillochloridaceae bacterium]